MPTIDPTTSLGRLRLRVSDWGDLPILPDSVYVQTLIDVDNNINRAAAITGCYILGILSQRHHRKLGQLESWSNEQFKQYLVYLDRIVKDPSYNGSSPIPYGTTVENPIADFQDNWVATYPNGTEAQQLATNADNSANENTRRGIL